MPISSPSRPQAGSGLPNGTHPASYEPQLEKTLDYLVSSSGQAIVSEDVRGGDGGEGNVHVDVRTGTTEVQVHADTIHTTSPSSLLSHSWIRRLWPSPETLNQLFAYEHMGNFVIDRKSGKKEFESMPLYVRVGMHLLFCEGKGFDKYRSVEDLLIRQSVAQGKIYDKEGPEVLAHIQSFMKTYALSTDELLIKDLNKYPTFNSFFSRRLVSSARPIDSPQDPGVVVSPADCRLTVYRSVDDAKKFWVKGKEFSIPSLLGQGVDVATHHKDKQPKSPEVKSREADQDHFKIISGDNNSCMLAISRLAPQDYHRFHSPVDAVIGKITDIHGELYTVNPQAVNEDLDVFTLNKRSVMMMEANLGPGNEKTPIAFVAIGAMLVGSIGWSKKTGDTIRKGEELGWFQYGGSTVITVFPSAEKTGLKFDDDLLTNSEQSIETVVQVGNRIACVERGVPGRK